MRKLAFFIALLFSLFNFSALVQAQDSSKKVIIIRCISSFSNSNNPLIIVDGAYYSGKLESINVAEISDVHVLKDSAAKAIYGSKGANGVLIITTKEYAQKKYQKKLSAYSKKYKIYLQNRQNDDSDLVYVLNGSLLERTANGNLIKKLYEIPVQKIKTVTLMDRYFKDVLNNDKPIVLITTKQ